MYINKIDEIIDNIVNDFYVGVISKKEFQKYLKEINFVKFQPELNKMTLGYMKDIKLDSIKEVIKDDDHVKKIVEIIKKYIGYYIFLTFAFGYSGSIDSFVNNIIEFTKNQHKFNYKIDNFFNSESNANIIRYFNLIKLSVVLLNSDPNSLKQLVTKDKYKDAFEYLNTLGSEYVTNYLVLSNLKGDVNMQCHNFVKTLIFKELYLGKDKNIIYDYINEVEIEKGKFIYIDVVIPQKELVDFNTIEMSLTKYELDHGLANEIYDLIMESQTSMEEIDHDKKIGKLINSNFLIPVTEDFLLFHKDIEKYEQIKYNPVGKKKKDDTKLKYIVSKIESTTDYYSKHIDPEQKKNIEKNYYVPLLYRRSILFNNMEDVRILYKIIHQGGITNELMGYYNDFTQFRKYPYINFKEFNKYGLVFSPSKTNDAVRSINFEKVNSMNQNNILDYRVCTRGNPIHIVGFIIPAMNNNIKCLRIKDIIDIRKIGYKVKDKVKSNPNGYRMMLKIMKKKLFSVNHDMPAIYWEFDITSDIVKLKYENVHDSNEYIKLMISKLYDDISKIINNKIKDYFNDSENMISLQHFDRIISKVNKKMNIFKSNTLLYDNLFKHVYENNIVRSDDVYDSNEDVFHGVHGDVTKLPKYRIEPPKPVYQIVRVSPERKRDIQETTEKVYSDANTLVDNQIHTNIICQHNLAWDTIINIRRKDPKRYSELFFNFFQQFVIQNYEDDFICKSCDLPINLKNYVLSGSYDSDGNFVSFSTPFEVPIEDIPEYEKYKSTIRDLIKIVDRIGSVAGINTITGNTKSIKIRIRQIVKEVLDMVLVHTATLKNVYKERSEHLDIYGINKNMTNLWFFDLDNNIFVYSSKDKDFYKTIKKNNVLIYVLFMVVLEISDSQYYYLNKHKICNYYLFEKYGLPWFENIMILKNNQRELVPILNYKLLCYIIFYLSCLALNYNLWETESTPDKTKKFDPTVHKIIVITFIDFINSLIEVYSKKKHSYLYDIIVNKFFLKLNTTFAPTSDILDKIKAMNEKHVAQAKKHTGTRNMVEMIDLPGTYKNTRNEYTGIWLWLDCKCSRELIGRKPIDSSNAYNHLYNINEVTNCKTGQFHKWVFKDNIIVCTICGSTPKVGLKDAISLPDSQLITNNYVKLLNDKIAKKYCTSGSLHKFVHDDPIGKSICSKCNMEKGCQLSNDEVAKLLANKNKSHAGNNNTFVQLSKIKVDKFDNKIEYINELKNTYSKSKQHKEDYLKFISSFIDKLSGIIGDDININNQNIYLKFDSYVINHDHNGYIIEKPFVFVNTDNNKIKYIQNHDFFKTNVLYYTNYKLQIEVYYDALTRLLLGYREKNKEYMHAKRFNIYLRRNLSILNLIKILGYPTDYVDIGERLAYYKMIYVGDDNDMTDTSDIASSNIKYHIMLDNVRDRINKIKKTVNDIETLFYRIIYGSFTVEANDPFKAISEKYKGKFESLQLREGKGHDDKGKDKGKTNDKFLNEWKTLRDNLVIDKSNIKPDNSNYKIIHDQYLYVDTIINYDYSGNILLFYIINEINRLLSFNDSKVMKTTLIYLFLDIIIYLHYDITEDKYFISELKRFKYTLKIMDTREIELLSGSEEEASTNTTVNTDTEDDVKYDIEQENEALDMEDKIEFDNMDYD